MMNWPTKSAQFNKFIFTLAVLLLYSSVLIGLRVLARPELTFWNYLMNVPILLGSLVVILPLIVFFIYFHTGKTEKNDIMKLIDAFVSKSPKFFVISLFALTLTIWVMLWNSPRPIFAIYPPALLSIERLFPVGNTADSTNQLKFHLQVHNKAEMPLTISQLSMFFNEKPPIVSQIGTPEQLQLKGSYTITLSHDSLSYVTFPDSTRYRGKATRFINPPPYQYDRGLLITVPLSWEIDSKRTRILKLYFQWQDSTFSRQDLKTVRFGFIIDGEHELSSDLIKIQD